MVILVEHTANLPVESCHWQDVIRDGVYRCRVAAIFAAIISTASPGEVFVESMTSPHRVRTSLCPTDPVVHVSDTTITIELGEGDTHIVRRATTTAVTTIKSRPPRTATKPLTQLRTSTGTKMKRINRHTALAAAADTARMCLVPRHAMTGQRRCYKPAPGGGELGRIGAGWGKRCRSSGRRSREDPAPSRARTSCRPMSSLARLRLRWCCQRAEAVCSCAAPVGRGSLGWMPLAARHTATSPMMARFGRLPGGAHTGWVSSWRA